MGFEKDDEQSQHMIIENLNTLIHCEWSKLLICKCSPRSWTMLLWPQVGFWAQAAKTPDQTIPDWCSDLDNVFSEKIHDCYDSFFFICHSSFASLPSLRTVLRNTFRLNTASFLHAVHGSLTPFSLTFYRRPSFTHVTLTWLLPIHRTAQVFPLYPPWLLWYEHCLVRALHSHLFKRRHNMYSL